MIMLWKLRKDATVYGGEVRISRNAIDPWLFECQLHEREDSLPWIILRDMNSGEVPSFLEAFSLINEFHNIISQLFIGTDNIT